MELTIEQRVRAVISDELSVQDCSLVTTARLREDLGADSMDSYSLTLALQDEFGIEIPDHDVAMLQTVGQVMRYIQEQVGTASGYGHGV